MFDNILVRLCPESRKYIIGNIIVQWLELCLNALMIINVANLVKTVHNNGNNE